MPLALRGVHCIVVVLSSDGSCTLEKGEHWYFLCRISGNVPYLQPGRKAWLHCCGVAVNTVCEEYMITWSSAE